MTRPAEPDATVVLVGGHESGNGTDLSFLADYLPDAHITPAGRPLHNLLTQLRGRKRLASDPAPVVVLPMTFGRNPTLIADVAKTLKWLEAGADASGLPLVLADPFGTGDHLTAWLRAAATNVHHRAPEAGMLIMADAANPFDDAELYRISHLVRTHGAGNQVETATVESPAEVVDAVKRLRLLGSTETVVVPAGFRQTATLHGDPLPFGEGALADAGFYGSLLSGQAALRVIRERVLDALHNFEHGHNGIEAGLQADHGHGYAHSHAFDAANGHSHTHGQGASAGHTHFHPAPIGST